MKFSYVEIPERLFTLARDHMRSLPRFTVEDIRQHLLIHGQLELARCHSLKQNWRLLATRVLRAVLTELKDANEIAQIQRGVWARIGKLTNLETGIICTIHQKPDYRFLGPELRAARRLAAAGYLTEGSDKHFTVTATGELAYRHSTKR
jgi:hypothetical protein